MKRIVVIIIVLMLVSQFGQAQRVFQLISKHKLKGIETCLKKGIANDDLFKTMRGYSEFADLETTFSVIEFSVYSGCKECVELFMSDSKIKSQLNVAEELSKSVAHAVENNDVLMLDFLLQQGVDVNSSCEWCYRQKPVQIALNNANFPMFFGIYDAGANVMANNMQGHNLLHSLALSFNNGVMFYQLSDSVAELSEIMALNVAHILLDNGVDINATDIKGYTPLMYAAATNNAVFYNFFRKNSEIPDLSDAKAVVSWLNQSMWYMQEEKNDVFYQNLFFDIIKDENIRLRADLIETNDYYGNNMVFNALFAENNQVCLYLLRHKINFAMNHEGLSLMQWAIVYRNEEVCMFLLDNNVTVDKETYKMAKKTFNQRSVLMDNFANALSE